MSGLSGQAEITITKPDGRVIRRVITNNIVDAVFTQLQNRIKVSVLNVLGIDI